MFATSLSNLAGRNRNRVPADSILKDRGTMPMASDSCTGCGTCAGNCPTAAITIDGDGWSVDLGKCIFCMDCAMVCPSKAISETDSPDYALDRGDLVVHRGTDIKGMEKQLDKETRRMFSGSLAIRELDTGSCNACEIELNCMSNQFYDAHRFGIKFVASPRHADALMVTGPMAENMREAVARTDEATPSPKLVIANGTCAISGGVFVGGDVAPSGICDVLEPDVYVIGCPPSPNRVVRALVKALGMRH